MGYRIIKGHPARVLPEGICVPQESPMGLALHNVEEFYKLAVLLPKVYAEFGSQSL